MAGEEAIINIIADALGISPQAQAFKRNNQLNYYNQGITGLSQGFTLKESGIDPAVVEKTLGPDYAAHLQGLEKTDAFKQAVQSRQTQEYIHNAIGQYLTAPEAQSTQAFMGGGPANAAPSEDVGFYPRLSGPGISPGAEVATAALTRPSALTMEERLKQVPGLGSVYAGSQNVSQQIAKERLENVEIPEAQTSAGQLGVAQGQLGVAQANARMRAQEEQNRVDQANRQYILAKTRSRRATIDSAGRIIATTHPGLTIEQADAAAKYRAGFGTIDDLKKAGIDNVPGLVKGIGPSGADMRALNKRLNDIADRVPMDVVANAEKAKIKPSQEELDGQNNAALREFTLAAADVLRESGITPTTEAVTALARQRMGFATRQGSRTVTVPFSDLEPGRMNAQIATIQRTLASGGGAGGLSPAAQQWQAIGQGQAPPAPAGPANAAQQNAPQAGGVIPVETPPLSFESYEPGRQVSAIQQETARLNAGGELDRQRADAIRNLQGSASPAVRKAVEDYSVAYAKKQRERVRRPPGKR